MAIHPARARCRSPRSGRLLAAQLAAVVLLVSPLSLAAAETTDSGLALDGEALAAKVAEIARQAITEDNAVGLSVAVAVGPTMLVDAGFGTIDLENGIAADSESVFRIGSITKQFTAAAVMKLIEDGATLNGKTFTLDSPITDFVDFPTHGHTVTVRHLLTHTSGIKSYTDLGAVWFETIPLEMTHERLLGLVKDKEFDFDPDTAYRYSNTGFYLLGVLIEKVSGLSYADYLQKTFFEPLELERIRYGDNRTIVPHRAQGYAMEDGKLVNDGLIGMSQPGAAGALISTAGDLVRWQIAMASGRVVRPGSYRQMATAHTLADGSSVAYGFGLGIGDLSGIPMVSHGGGINGFNSMLAYFPEQRLSVAVISNSETFRASSVSERIARAALGVERQITDLDIESSELERVVGTYVLTGTPLELVISSRDGKLFASATGQGESRLRNQGEEVGGGSEYRPDFDDNVRLVIDPGTPAPSLTLYQGGAAIKGPRKER